jgi:hypothetical protein
VRKLLASPSKKTASKVVIVPSKLIAGLKTNNPLSEGAKSVHLSPQG